MSRVNDDELHRLATALSAPDAAKRHGSRDESSAQHATFQRMQTELAQKAGEDALGRSLTQLLAAYLNRPVRAIAGGATGVIPGAWHYVARRGPIQWWIGFEAPLAAGLADAMLGGTGSSVKSGGGRRARALVGKVADLFFEALSSIVDAPPPSPAIWTDADLPDDRAQLGGSCVVGAQPFAWQAGVEFTGEVEQNYELTYTRRPIHGARQPESVSIALEMPANRVQAAPAQGPIERDEIGEIHDIIAAACAGLFEILHCPVAVASPTVTEVEVPEVPEAALRLALTTGGKGALVVCAQRDAVVAFASGAVGARLPETEETGSVVRAAADAVLREIINGIAARLTRVSGVPQRIVYLAADAQLARTRHMSASITLQIAGNAANLRVLVPRWMTGAA